MWQLACTRSESLPRLAWCAVLSTRHAKLVVHHGPWVEVNDSAFVEGAWSGDYSDMGFANANTFTGSGGMLRSNDLLIATPTHTSECIYALRLGTGLIFSNCLAFLLTIAEDDVDRSYQYYDIDIMSIGLGLKRYRSSIPTALRNKVHMYYYCNISVSPGLALTVLPKKRPGWFYTYHQYRGWLQQEVSATIQNAGDSRRAVAYTPITTISTGYDSTAAAVLARDGGCREAVTFSMAHDPFGVERCDSGKRIGDILGIAVTEYDRGAYLGREDLPEAEFLAAGAGGGDVTLTALDERLTGKLLITGYHGDPAWDRINNTGGPDMIRLDPSPGGDLIYFRTRVGFTHLPVPSIGYSEHSSILALSNSLEMQPWSLRREHYDRPIPRRIVEEAGVPRETFGQTKKIVARPQKFTDLHTIIEDPDLRMVMAPASYKDFEAWTESVQPRRDWWELIVFSAMHRLYRWNMRAVHSRKVRRVARRLGLELPRVAWISSKYGQGWTRHRLLFHWGMEKVMPWYSAGGGAG
jgi:hypothetical protein